MKVKNNNEESDEGYFLEFDVQYLEKNYMNFIMIDVKSFFKFNMWKK